jgi:hypothetical protein
VTFEFNPIRAGIHHVEWNAGQCGDIGQPTAASDATLTKNSTMSGTTPLTRFLVDNPA